MTQFTSILVEPSNGMARITLNRPERRNAFDDRMAGELCEAFEDLGKDPSMRVIVLAGAGLVFCAGADLRWMSPEKPISERQAREDAERLIRMYRAIDECPCPVIGRIHGAAFGGGVGLIAVCDIVCRRRGHYLRSERGQTWSCAGGDFSLPAQESRRILLAPLLPHRRTLFSAGG